jgi:transposase
VERRDTAERGVRPVAVGRHNWTFLSSDEGGRRAAGIYALIETCKLNDVDPQLGSPTCWRACLIIPPSVSTNLPCHWKRAREQRAAA